jgi:hypothetical protein
MHLHHAYLELLPVHNMCRSDSQRAHMHRSVFAYGSVIPILCVRVCVGVASYVCLHGHSTDSHNCVKACLTKGCLGMQADI